MAPVDVRQVGQKHPNQRLLRILTIQTPRRTLLTRSSMLSLACIVA